jgi:hypothetical protein
MNKKNFFYYPIYNVSYCEKIIGDMLSGLVLLDGGIGSTCSWAGSTWPIAELTDSIVVIDKVNVSIINIVK